MTVNHEQEFEYERELLKIAERHFVPGCNHAAALKLLRTGYQAATPKQRSRMRKSADLPKGKPPPEWLLELLLGVLGTGGLFAWARRFYPGPMQERGATLAGWLTAPPLDFTDDELKAGLRFGLGITRDNDNKTIEARLGQLLRRVTVTATQFVFDPRAIPLGFNEAGFKTIVGSEVTATVPAGTKQSTTDFVFGAMSLDGFLPQTSDPVLREAARQLAFDTGDKTVLLTGALQSNRVSIEAIAREIDALRQSANGASVPQAFFEELAFVSRRLLANANSVPIDTPGLRGRVSEALTLYVPGQAGGTLDLPPLDAPETVGSDLVRDNIRAVALLYAGWNLEEMQLFRVLDRVIEVFMNGQLPVGFDNGGRALSDYYFSADEVKISEAARRMTYTRVLGVPGGEVSPEAPPNRAFQDLFLRFLASVSEFDRQRRIADVVAGSRSRDDALSLTGEQVRKAGRDLAANVTLYGYGGTFFVAQKLKDQVEQSLRILSTPQILSAYGVLSPFQVIERVCASDFGGKVPNIVRYKTMAEAGKKILDIVAANIPAWLGLSGNDLFEDPFDRDSEGPQPDIPPNVQRELARATEDWLAVNGIKDEQRARLGEPEITVATPSIPTATADGGGAAFDQLRQMVSSGQTPSIDQLKALIPDAGGLVRL